MPLPIFRRDLEEWSPFLDAGVVDQDIKTSQLAKDFAHRGFNCLDGADVSDGRHGSATEFPDLRGCSSGGLGVDVDDADVGALAGESRCDGFADPLAAPGDDGHLSFQDHVLGLPLGQDEIRAIDRVVWMSKDIQKARAEGNEHAVRAIPLSSLERGSPCGPIDGDIDALPAFRRAPTLTFL